MALVPWTIVTLEAVPRTLVLPVNPNDMDSPEMAYTENTPQPATTIGRRFTGTNRLDPMSEMAVLAAPTQPMQWAFSGVLYTLYDVEQLEAMMTAGRSHVTDHFARTWLVLFQDFDVQRAPHRQYMERHTYSMKCLMMGRVS